jgi:hypothetical protein
MRCDSSGKRETKPREAGDQQDRHDAAESERRRLMGKRLASRALASPRRAACRPTPVAPGSPGRPTGPAVARDASPPLLGRPYRPDAPWRRRWNPPRGGPASEGGLRRVGAHQVSRETGSDRRRVRREARPSRSLDLRLLEHRRRHRRLQGRVPVTRRRMGRQHDAGRAANARRAWRPRRVRADRCAPGRGPSARVRQDPGPRVIGRHPTSQPKLSVPAAGAARFLGLRAV